MRPFRFICLWHGWGGCAVGGRCLLVFAKLQTCPRLTTTVYNWLHVIFLHLPCFCMGHVPRVDVTAQGACKANW